MRDARRVTILDTFILPLLLIHKESDYTEILKLLPCFIKLEFISSELSTDVFTFSFQ